MQLHAPHFSMAESVRPRISHCLSAAGVSDQGSVAAMHVLVLASQKGGSGKTTLSGHLAVEADKAGIGPVALIDTDPQGSLSQWWNAREAETPYFAHVGVLELGDALAHLQKSGVKLAIIDTPPAITVSISQVVAH